MHASRFLMLTVLLAGLCLTPVTANPAGGGTVSNVSPTFPSFATTSSYFPNPSTVVFSGTVRDGNGESDLADLFVDVQGPTDFQVDADPSSGISVPAEPSTYTSNFKVWNSNTNGSTMTDGVLQFRFQWQFTVQGTYTVRMAAADEAWYEISSSISIFVGDRVSASPEPVNAAGQPMINARWGNWTASPGANMVASTNYLKLTNTGPTAGQAFTVDFAPMFNGPGTSFAVDNNLQLACVEATGGETPADLTFSFGGPSPNGAISPSFTAQGNVIYCTYRLMSLPQVVRDGQYSAPYTLIAA